MQRFVERLGLIAGAYLRARPILVGIAIGNFIVIAFFTWHEPRYPSYCIWPWYIVSPLQYVPALLLVSAILLLWRRWWTCAIAATISLVAAYLLVGVSELLYAILFLALVQPSRFFQLLFGLALLTTALIGLVVDLFAKRELAVG